MLYELIAIVRPGNVQEIKEIARNAGTLILRSRGVVRGITNWGPFLLPKPTMAHQTKHHSGHYFIMRFDASAVAQAGVRRSLDLDPRMIRFSVVKLAERLGGGAGAGAGGGRPQGNLAGLEEVQGGVDWATEEDVADVATRAFFQKHRGKAMTTLSQWEGLEDEDEDDGVE